MKERGLLPEESYVRESESIPSCYSVEEFCLISQNSWHDRVAVVNSDRLPIGSLVEFFFPVCPLYSQNSLEESELLHDPESVFESRVGNKWKGLRAVITGTAEYLQQKGVAVHLRAVLADKGVLLSRSPEEKDFEALEKHGEFYARLLDDFGSKIGVTSSFGTFESCGVRFPTFVNPQMKIPGFDYSVARESSANMMAGLLIDSMNGFLSENEYLGGIVNNKRRRRMIAKMVNSFGIESTFWIVTGYLAFDPMIPEVMHQDGVYLVTERFDPLFGIANCTPELSKIARINIKA